MLSESDRAFFRPKWRRVVTTLFCAGWAIIEWTADEPIWAMISAGITVYCLWNFFYKFEEKTDEDNTTAS